MKIPLADEWQKHPHRPQLAHQPYRQGTKAEAVIEWVMDKLSAQGKTQRSHDLAQYASPAFVVYRSVRDPNDPNGEGTILKGRMVIDIRGPMNQPPKPKDTDVNVSEQEKYQDEDEDSSFGLSEPASPLQSEWPMPGSSCRWNDEEVSEKEGRSSSEDKDKDGYLIGDYSIRMREDHL